LYPSPCRGVVWDYNSPAMSYLYPRRRGMNIFPVVLLLATGAGLGLGAAFLALAPRVVSFSPQADSRTGSYTSIEIQFSVPMDPACTADHFSVAPAVEGELSIAGSGLRFAPKDPWPAGTAVSASIQAGACSRRGLPLLAGRAWSFAPSLSRVAYVPIGGLGGRLMGATLDGEDPVALAQVPSPIQNFDISARGDFAVLSTAFSGNPGNLWITRLDGQAAELLLDCGEDSCRDPAISPDGSFVAYVREQAALEVSSRRSVELLTVADGQVRAVSPAGHSAGNPIWSKQGWLSYYDETRLVILAEDLAGGQTAVPNVAGGSWSWLPDGSGLIFPEMLIEDKPEIQSNETAPRLFSQLTLVDVKTNRRTNLSGMDLLEDASPAVSPDGRRLAFSRNFFDGRWTPGRQLWILDLADLSARRISLAPEYSHSSIHWSPDGSQLVFMLFHETIPTDPPEIWCMNADGSDPRRLVVGGFLPQWLP
jgi:hypothetical protein